MKNINRNINENKKNNSSKLNKSNIHDFTYALCDDISPETLKQMYVDFNDLNVKNMDTLYLVLCSNGGSPSCAYEMAHYIRNYARRVIGLFPSTTYSSSVLLGLSCNQQMFGRFSAWGPLDVQVPYYTADRGYDYDSTENIDACYKALINYGVKAMDQSVRMIVKRTKLNSADSIKLSKHMVDAVVQPVLSKIDPNTLGAYHRGSELATMYGVRILKDIMNMEINKAWDICYDLTKKWPTHGFHIKPNELQMYGLPVKKPSSSILDALDAMKFRLDEADPFQGFIDGNTVLSTMNKIAA